MPRLLALAAPALCLLLTGLFPHQHGVYFNLVPGQQAAAVRDFRALKRVPDLLAKAGYASLQTGKFWEGHHSNGGFTHGMSLGDESALENHPTLSGFVGPHGDHGLRIGREGLQPILDFLDGLNGEPFLLWFSPLMPHVPNTAPAEFEAPYHGQGLRPNLLSYFAMCSWFDANVGELLDHLERRGLTDNTLVVFVVDNGSRPRGGLPYFQPRTKASPFEMGVRTPLLLRWPGRIP